MAGQFGTTVAKDVIVAKDSISAKDFIIAKIPLSPRI